MTKVSFMNIMDFSSMNKTEQGLKQNYIKQTKHAYTANKAASGFFFVFHQMTLCVSDHFLCVCPPVSHVQDS